jgi:hypothetical protein
MTLERFRWGSPPEPQANERISLEIFPSVRFARLGNPGTADSQIGQSTPTTITQTRCKSNVGLSDGNARYNLPPAEIQRLVADFIAQVSGT